jgi:TPR repeat protein
MVPHIFSTDCTDHMRKLTATLCLTLAVLLGSVAMSWSADYQKGVAAYIAGDYETAHREWVILAQQGHAKSQSSLAVLYDGGKGVLQNYKTAVKWYRLAAKQGDAAAQYNLGVVYSSGQGVPRDYETAAKWYGRAAEQGVINAQTNLCTQYYQGQGVIQDHIYAHMWCNIAASRGDKVALKNRDIVAKRMTPADLSAAQKLARECVRKKYKGC